MELNVFTMCRSGNHAIIFWLINNICEIEDCIQGCCYWSNTDQLYYYNNCNHYNYNFIDKFKYQIKSYEDIMINNELNGIVIILRDYVNFIASRYKKYGKSLGLNSSYLQSYEEIRNLWINLCNEIITNKKVIGIIYDKWLIDKKYRDSISNKIGVPNINDNTSIVSDIGEGSSFCGVKLEDSSMNYLNRFNKELFGEDQDLYYKILNDYENNITIKNISKILFT